MEIGAEAAQFPEKEYIKGIAVAVYYLGHGGEDRAHTRDRRDEGKDKVHSSTAEEKMSNQKGREGKWPPQGFGGTGTTYGIGKTWAIS